MQNINVVIWGFGAMGQGIGSMLLEKEGVTIKGVCDLNPTYEGKSISSILEKPSKVSETFVSKEIEELLTSDVDVVFLATDSFTKKSYPKIKQILEQNINVISTAEEMAYPYASEPELSKEINELAIKNNVTVLGTGINPGFVMDLLAITLSGAMVDVESIEVRRVNSLSPFGKTVMDEQGVGISIQEFEERIKSDSLAGHVGFKESVYMIADALGVKIDHFDQQMKPIVTSVDRKSKYGEAKKGNLAGIDMTAQATVKGKPFIDMKHPQQIEPEIEGTETGDYIILKGTPNIEMKISPEIEGGLGTIAMCVNMLPHVINASPGLKTMIDLPVPRAIKGDIRKLIK